MAPRGETTISHGHSRDDHRKRHQMYEKRCGRRKRHQMYEIGRAGTRVLARSSVASASPCVRIPPNLHRKRHQMYEISGRLAKYLTDFDGANHVIPRFS